jgi:hypothetical protein
MRVGPVRSPAWWTIFFLLMCALSGSAGTNASEEVNANSNPLLSDVQPWCIGRFVLERPITSKLYFESYSYTGDTIEVVKHVTPVAFKNRISIREQELRNKKRTTYMAYQEMIEKGLKSTIIETDMPWLEKAASPTEFSRVLIYRKFAHATSTLFYGEGYVLAGPNMMSMTFMLGEHAVEKVIRDESDWYRNVTYRDDWAVPTERGFCIKGALIGGPSRNSEVVEQTIDLIPGNYALFMIKMRAAVAADHQSTLLSSLPDLRADLRSQGYSHNVRVLRAGKRQIADMDAEEVLLSIKEGGVQLFRFYLIAAGNPDTTAQPHTDIQLLLGEQPRYGVPPSEATSPVDEATAIQTWDTLLNSLRLRPGAM